MGQVVNIIEDWTAADPKRTAFYKDRPGFVLRWINEGQLRFADESEILRSSWSPTVSSGTASLPSDFLREAVDRVKWSDTVRLTKIDYGSAKLVTSFGSTLYYSIWADTFYVWDAANGSPVIPYIAKPSVILIANITTADFDSKFPTEFQNCIVTYLDAMWQRKDGDLAGGKLLLKEFDADAASGGHRYRLRRDPPRILPSSQF